jgi:hypothetical protein
VPCSFDLALKLSTITSPFFTAPAVTGATATEYGFSSPLAGVVAPSVFTDVIPARNAGPDAAAASGAVLASVATSGTPIAVNSANTDLAVNLVTSRIALPFGRSAVSQARLNQVCLIIIIWLP